MLSIMSVRTTLTLEDDVAAKLRDEARRNGKSFKATVNAFLRRGLESAVRTKPEPFRVRARNLKPKAPLNYDNIADLLEKAEGSFHK